MSAIAWGSGMVGWNQGGDVGSLAATLSTLNSQAVYGYRVASNGSATGAAVGAGATVRFPLPAILERFPNDVRWNRPASGVLEYDGALAGVYVCLCNISAGTSLAVLASYTWSLVEGTALDTGSPVLRDATCTFTMERQIAAINTTVGIQGFITLQPTGGQLALRVSHNQGLSATITPSVISLLLHRVSQGVP